MAMVVNSVAYRAGKRLSDVTIDDISEVVKEPDTFVWVGLWQPDDTFLRKIQEEFGLHDLAIEDALTAHQRPKIEVYGDSLFIVIKTAQLVDGEVQYGETHLFVGKNFLVTVRHGASSSYAAIRTRVEENPKLLSKGPGYALYSVLDFVVDNYRPIVSQFEEQFDALEADMFTSDFDQAAVEKLYDLRRHLLKLRNAAIPMDDICNQLIRFHEDTIPKDLRAYVRDVQDHAHQVITTTEDMREMLTNAMHVNLALVSVRQNEVVKRLAGWAAILAVPTLIFSMYGMNFEWMPELKTMWGYPVTLFVTVTGCATLYWRLKSAGWV
ncbi:magnesium/cobalt transporter CorA [Burkholderia sp. PAMC 26561]|uniref:magnesium/cobalt transporter CorA n=1 Tax=Burkholderia sp. PAMC 26561 TaxID=1795043 RepID=UPI00076B8B0B|nr:magnesium/cobalt transporter CorA [Burkholderia sp. PAMC 26561]AME26865.1 magnesium transporter [Burkholderia sp. PAMC 26561]AME27990.1 magnesium transporter [Burkholderia sp. PAMC 26561]